MLISGLIILCLLSYHYSMAFYFVSENSDTKELGIRFRQTIQNTINKMDNLNMNKCRSGSFFYNGSCYYYLPPKQTTASKDTVINAISIDEAAMRCHSMQAKLWDIETVDEFSFVLNRIYTDTQSYDTPRIAVNFVQGRRLLNLRKKSLEQQYLFINNIDHYSLIFKPLMDLSVRNTSIIIDISKATRRISLEEKFRLERRSDHYICKIKVNSCYNNTRCGPFGQCTNLLSTYKCICNFMYTGEHCEKLSSRGIQSIIGIILICLASLIIVFLPIYHSVYELKNKIKTLMQTKTSSRTLRENFYSIPNFSSDQLLKQDDSLRKIPHTVVNVRRLSIDSSTSSTVFYQHSYLFYIWRLFIWLITILLTAFCCYTIYDFKLESTKSANLPNGTDTTSYMCKFFLLNLNIYYEIPVNYISLIILLLLILTLIVFENFSEKKKFKSCLHHLSMPMIFNSHSHIYRFESAAVFGIISLEILHIFDEFIMNGTKHFQNGPLADLILQFGIGLILGLRYFPLLAIFEKENNYENRLANIICYALAAIYLYCEIVFKLQSDINCAMDENRFTMIKQIFDKFSQMGINIQEYLMIQLGTNRTNQFNETIQNSQLWLNEQITKHINSSTYDNTDDVENDLTRLNYLLGLNKRSAIYNTLRYLPFYYFIVYLAVHVTLMFFKTFRNTINRNSYTLKSTARWKYVEYNLFKSHRYTHDNHPQEYSYLFRFFNYIIYIFKQRVYTIRPYFRYSKLIICIYTSAFTLIYYFTFWIQDYTYILTKKLLFFLNLVLCTLADLSKDLCYNLDLKDVHRDVAYICFLTAFITCLQLFFGLKHYQMQMCNAYRGIFNDIPTSKQISTVTVVSKSIHYPGRFMGSLIYSYGFLFLFVSTIYILFRSIMYSMVVLQFAAKLFLPMIIFLLFQLLSVRLLCKLLFVEKTQILALRNLRLYYTFSYFCFFFDCFLGFLMCLTRITKAFLCSIVFFARLDYSPYGRGLEMYDSSYASYVCFFHMEKSQRHPVLNVFIDIVRQRLIDIRKLKYQLSVGKIQDTYEKDKSLQIVRFRWALFYTLIKNEQLKRYRKHRLYSTRTMQSRTLERIFDRIGLTQTLPRRI